MTIRYLLSKNSVCIYITALSVYITALSVYITALSVYITVLSVYITALSVYITSLSVYITALTITILSSLPINEAINENSNTGSKMPSSKILNFTFYIE